jgi:hypothetical protein
MKIKIQHSIVAIATVILLSVNPPSVQGAATVCDAELSNFINNGALVEQLNELLSIDSSLLRAERIPKWEDFNRLDQITKTLKSYKEAKASEAKLDELHEVFKKIETSFIQKYDFDIVHTYGTELPDAYLPTEYELKLLYQQELEELNAELPRGMRLILPDLPFPDSREGLKEKAIQLVQKQTEDFKKYFPSSGFASLEDFDNAVKGSGEAATQLLNRIKNDEFRVAMRRPNSARWWIPKVGFQNQYVTGSSRGFSGKQGRYAVEASLLHRQYADYAPLDDDLKPKYGYLAPRPEIDSRSSATSGYGDDIYYFKKERIKDRITWTPGDSLNRLSSKASNVLSGEVAQVDVWDQTFIPWSHRDLMIQAMQDLTEYQESVSLSAHYNSTFQRKAMASDYYIEIQYWGPINLDDIDTFEFTYEPPEGEFLQELQKRGIKIRDASVTPPKDWTLPAGSP